MFSTSTSPTTFISSGASFIYGSSQLRTVFRGVRGVRRGTGMPHACIAAGIESEGLGMENSVHGLVQNRCLFHAFGLCPGKGVFRPGDVVQSGAQQTQQVFFLSGEACARHGELVAGKTEVEGDSPTGQCFGHFLLAQSGDAGFIDGILRQCAQPRHGICLAQKSVAENNVDPGWFLFQSRCA